MLTKGSWRATGHSEPWRTCARSPGCQWGGEQGSDSRLAASGSAILLASAADNVTVAGLGGLAASASGNTLRCLKLSSSQAVGGEQAAIQKGVTIRARIE